MAREPTMNYAQSLRIPSPDESWSSLTGLSEHRMLTTLGNNLRDVYDSMTDAAQPSDLMRLAAMIDEQRDRSER